MESVYEALKQQRAQNNATTFAGMPVGDLQTARASLAEKTDEALDKQDNGIESNIGGADLSAHNNDTQSATEIAPPNPNTKSVMFEHLKAQEQQQEQQEQNQQTQEQDKQQEQEQLKLIRGIGNQQHWDKRDKDIANEYAKMRENTDLIAFKYEGKPMLATTREIFEIIKNDSIEEQIEFVKNAVNYTQSVEAAKKQGKSEAAFIKELGFPLSIKRERIDRLREEYMKNQKSLDYEKRNAHLKDKVLYNEIQEVFDVSWDNWLDNSGIGGAPFKFFSGLFGFASEGSIPVTKDQSVDEQIFALQDESNKRALMEYIHTAKSAFKEESLIGSAVSAIKGESKELEERTNQRLKELLQEKMPSIQKVGKVPDGRFFIEFPDNQTIYFDDGFFDYLDTAVKNNQMEAAAGIVAALVAAPLAAYAGAGAVGGFFLTTAAGALGSGLGADKDFKRIAANAPIGTYTSEDWGTKVRDAAALSIVGDLAIGGAIYGAKAAWRAIPTAEKGGKRYAQKHGFFSEDVESKMATQDKYFTIDKARQGFFGRLVHGGVKDEEFLNRLEAGLQSQSVSTTAKRLSPVMNDTIADNVFDTNKKAQELFDSLLKGDHNRVAQLEKDIAEITQDLKNRFNALEETLKEHVQITGAIPESFIEKVERDVARTISATDSRLHSTLDDIFGLMRNAGNVKDLIEIEKFVGQALVENYKHYSAKKILNHLQYNISKTIDDSIKSTFKNMPELGENLIKERAALKAEWRNFAFQKSRVGFDEMSQSFRQHQNLDNFVHAAQANVTHDDVTKGFAKEPQKRTSYSIGEKEMSESELESFLQTLGKGRENVELIVLNGIVHRAEKKIGKDFVVDNMSIYNDLKSINPDLFKSDKGRQAYQILDELATQFKHDTEILRFAGRDVASEEFKYWGMQPLMFKIASRFFNSLRARFSEEAGFRYCLQLAMERKRSFKEIGEILAEQSENPKLTPQDKHALLETSKLMLKTWQEREKEIAKKEAAEKKAREKLKKEKLARDKENLLKTSGDDVGEDILPTEDLGTRIENADTMIFTDKDKGYAASYQIVDLNQLSTSFEYGTNYQFREIKQTETINHIRDNFDPKLIFTREGGFDGLPLVDNKGRAIVGNHRLEALQHLDDAHWESYAKEAFLKYGAKLERGQLLVRVLEPSIALYERIALAKAGNASRVHTDTERSLVIVGKYSDSINALINATSPVQPAFKDAANVNEMRALVAAAMNDPLEKESTNHALLLALCPELIARKRLLHREMPDVAEIIQQMLNDNAGALLLNAISPNAKNIDISKYLAGSLGRIAEARKFDKQRRDRFIQSSVENLNIDFKNIYDSEKVNGISAFEQFKADLIALALARFSKRENPSGNLYAFLKEIGETQEHGADNLFGDEYATTLWDNLLRINRIDLDNGEDAITLNIKKILEREKAYLAYKQQRERTEQQLEQFAFHNELLSNVQGKNALQFAMQTKMFGTQSEQNIAQEILAKQGYYLNHDGTLSLIEGKAKPKNPIETIREQAIRLYGDETPFMQDMREGWTNENIKQKWWIVPRGQHSIVEYAKEIDPNLVRFESAEVGSWFADFQGIVHKVAGKSQDMLMIEHHISNDIPPAKTWFFKNEDQTTHLMQAYNGEVLLVDTLSKTDNTRTILAKQHGKVFKTTIDENGTKETKEETANSIELFSRFLQESEGIETAGKGKANLVTKHADAESERLQEIAKSLKEEYPNYSQERVEKVSSYIATRFPNYDSKTAIESWELSRNILDFSLGHDEKELANFAYNIAAERHKLEQLLKIEPIQEFGTNYAEFYHNGIYAIQKVMQEKQGQVSGAFYREDLGDITITWGEVTDANKHKGYGLAHIVDKHPDMNMNLIAEIVEKGKLNIQNDVRARLEYGDYVVGLSREFKGEKVNFIITAFEKSNGNKGSLSPKPKITDESDNVSPTHTDNSTPPPINNGLKNSESVANVAGGNAVSKSSIEALEKELAELKEHLALLSGQEEKLRESLSNATMSRNQARKKIGNRNISIDDYIAQFEKEHGAESIRKQYHEIDDKLKTMHDKHTQLSRQIENDKDTLFRNTYPTLDDVDEAMRPLEAKLGEEKVLMREITQLENKFKDEGLTLSNNKIKSIISQNHLNISVKDYREKYNKEHGIDALQEQLQKLTKQHSELKESLKPTQEEWDKLYRLKRKMLREQELKERREEYAAELLEYGYTKEQVANLKSLAETNPLARQILENYESDTIGHGYSGYSMSNNAVNAYENGQKPLSKWNAEDANAFGEVIGQKVTLKFLKEFLQQFGERGYHHTSKMYNKTPFYSLSEALLSSRAREYLEKNLGAILTKAPELKPNAQITKQADDVLGQAAAKETEQASAPIAKQEPQTTNDVVPTDYAVDIEIATELAARDKKQRLVDNLEALRTLGELARGERLNAARQQSLARYSGFGGLMVRDVEGLRQLLLPIAENDAFVQHALLGKNLYDAHHRADILYSQIAANADNSYYTPHAIISAIWEHLGFVKGRVLEPSMGIGNFFVAMPRDIFGRVQKVGIEIDPIAAAIGKQLSPNVDVQAKSFYDFKSDVGFDLVIGNPPYGEHLKDFILKSVDSAKENGIIVQVVSSTFLDNAASRDVRAAIADKAELLGAVRLPSKTFSGTDIATDIVVFQKRIHRKNSTYWRGAKTYKEDSELTLNNYYHENPEHILGELVVGTTQYGQRWIVKQGEDIEDALHEKLGAILAKRENESDCIITRQNDVQEAVASGFTPHTFFLLNDTIMQAQKNAEPIPVDFLQSVRGNGAPFETLNKSAQTRRTNEAKKAESMARDYLALRDSLLAMRSSEARETTSAESLQSLRQTLNDNYDSFVQKFGKLSENMLLKKVFAQDPSFSSVVDLDARGRHQILDSRVIFPYQIPTKAKDIQDAIAISKGYAGRISEDYINTLLGDRSAAQKALENGDLFADAKGNLFTKDAFVVGDLGARIDAFKELKELNPQQKKALETLEAALPEPLDIHEIYYHPSSRFIPKEAMIGFFDSLGVKATYYKPTNRFIIDHKSGSHQFQTAYSATTDNMAHSATVVLESLLNNKPLRFSKQINGVKQSYPEQFAANKMAQDKLLDCFYAYMQKHYAKDIADSYNHTFRRIVANDFQDEPILYGANPDIKLHPHQKSAVAFAIAEPNVLLDHSVGAGKTFEMIAIASEWKRLGISKNPLFVVPNHLVEQWAKSFTQLYPASRVLSIPTNENERKRTLAMLANGGNDFDAVIMPHSTFDSIHLSNEKSAQYVYEEIQELEQFEKEIRRQRSKDPLTKREQERLEKSIAKKKIALQEKYDKLLETQGAKEESIAFEELGFDSLFVDEAHAYKNLGFLSANRNIRGMGNPVGSQKALNLLHKVRSMQEHEQRIVFATGTPLVNSVSEVYTWQRFLAPQFLKDNKIATFDRWIELFGQVSSELERTPVGTYKDIMRLRSFKNTSELSTLYRQFAHYVDVSQTHIKRPQVEQVSIQCQSSPQQKDYMQHLLKRYEALSKDETIEGFENDNFLNITTDGINAALDYRIIDKAAEDFSESKINRATSEMLKLYKESNKDLGTQLVFIDRSTPKPKRGIRDEIRNVFEEYYHAKDEKTEEALAQKLEEMAKKHHYDNIDEMRNAVYGDFSVYEDMRDKLIKAGIPKEQIAFIHDYTTDAQKAKLFADVNAGKIRFLFGSTKKMGAGMNVQERIVGLHHIDAAWNPADMEQRNGRAIRQGNLLAEKYADFKIKIFSYVTENSCDAVYYSKLEQKATSIKNFRSGHAQKDDLSDDVILTLEELKALATGDTRELEKASLNKELQNVQYQLNALKSADAFQEIERQNCTKDIKILPQEIANLKDDLDIAKQRKIRKLSEDEKESLRNLEIVPDNKEPLFRLDNYDVFLEKSPRGIYTLSAISDNGNEIVLLKQSEPPKNLAHYAQKLIEQSSAASIEARIAKKESELKNAHEKLKSIEQSTTGKEIATLEAKEKELSNKIAQLIKEMSGGAKKEEFTTLENGTIVFKDTLGKEHTISKEIQEQWTSTFGLKNIEESIEIALPDVVGEKIGKNIRINVGSLLKMVSQKREKYINELAEVLREPELVLGDDTILILARHLKDKDFFVNVSVDKGEYFASISNGIKEANNLRNKIQNGMEILYQSPNANSNLQTLLQASRYSTNKTDKANSTPQNIKNSLENGETHASLHEQLKKLERELAANTERIDKAMPEDKPKLREIHKELLQEKRRIKAELGDTANATRDTTTLVQRIQDTFKFSPQKARDLVQWHKESHPITKDEQGLPKVFYRLVRENSFIGRKVEFDVFSRQTSMKDIPNDIHDSAYGIAFYTHKSDIKPAHRNQSKLYEVFLRIKKPLDLDTIITKENMAEFEQLFKRNNEPKHLKANIAEFENKPLIEYLIQKGFDQYPYSLMRKNEKGIHGQLDFNNLADFLSLKGYDSATKTIVGEGKIIYMFNPNQIKSIENKGKFDSSNNIYQSNLHVGSGILTGSIAGIETDEEGNISFSPEKFVLGFLAGAAGSKAISSALQHLSKNKEHKKQAIDIIAQSLAQNVPDTLKKYPLLELVLPRKMSTSAQGLQAQTQTMISKLEQKEQRGLFNVVYNGKNATKIYKDLERIDEAIVLEKGTKKKGAAHIRIKHSTELSQEGYVTPLEIMNLGKDVRAFLKKHNEPFIDNNKARIYEWENNEKVRFRLVVNDTSSGNSNLPSASGDIITFYSDRNLKNPMQFKNPALRGI